MKYIVGFLLLAALVIVFVATMSYTYIGTALYNSMQSDTYQRSIDQSQARNQQQAEWNLQQAEKGLVFSERQQISGSIVSGWNSVLPWLFGVGTLGVSLVFLSLVRTVSAVGDATAQRARLVSRQIAMDPATGSFPLLLSEDGRFVMDVNSYSSMEVGREYLPQLQFVDQANRVRRLTIIGYNTSHARPGGPEVILPVLNEKYE